MSAHADLTPRLQTLSRQFVRSFADLELPARCEALAALTKEVPAAYWDVDEGDNRFFIVGQSPRLSNCPTRLTEQQPSLVEALTGFVRAILPTEVPFTAISVRTGPGRDCHRDLRNAPSPSLLIGLTSFLRGRLWIEDPKGTVEGWPAGGNESMVRLGRFHDVGHRPVVFSSKVLLHGTEKWDGEERKVLTAFTPQVSVNTCPNFRAELEALGFRPPLDASEMETFALSTYYGDRIVRQTSLSQGRQPSRKRSWEEVPLWDVSSEDEDADNTGAASSSAN